MFRYNLINRLELGSLLKVQPAKVKRAILGSYKLPDWHPDVWMITEGDKGKKLMASPGTFSFSTFVKRAVLGFCGT